MPATAQRSLILIANVLIWIFLALCLMSCASRPPVVATTADPIRICPAAVLYSDIPMPQFNGTTWADLAQYVAILQADARGLRSDRAAVRAFCE